MISLCSSKKPLRPHPPSTNYRFVMKSYAKMWVWKHSFQFPAKHFIPHFAPGGLGQEGICKRSKCCRLRVIHCTGLNWSKSLKSPTLFLGGEIFILFSKEIPTNLLKNEKLWPLHTNCSLQQLLLYLRSTLEVWKGLYRFYILYTLIGYILYILKGER